jgi:hypothetical protein
MLRRSPPYFVGESTAVQNVESMVQSLLSKIPPQHSIAAGLVSA